jgi:peptide/nickel transport system substrate-binding protein
MEIARVTRRQALRMSVAAAALPLIDAYTAGAAASASAQGRLIVALEPAEPHTLNGAISTRIGDQMVAGQIYNALLRFNAQGRPLPYLARSWKLSSDGHAYTFHLAPNIKWQDGVPFTSADVKFTFEQVLLPYHPIGKVNFSVVKSIETPNPQTVVFQLAYPFAPFISSLGPRMAMILPKHLYEGTDILNNPHNMQPVGTGPFKFVEWQRGKFLRLVRNPEYFETGRPYLQEVVFAIVPDASTLVSAMEANQVDYVPSGIPYNLVNKLRGELSPKGWIVGSFNYLYRTIGGLFFNLNDPVIKHRDVRHAIAYGVDKSVILRVALAGVGAIAQNPMPFYIANSDTPVTYPRNPAKANALLDAAGFRRGPDGTRFALSLIAYTSYPEMESIASLLRDELRDIGIAVKIEDLDDAAAISRIYDKHDFQMALDNPGIGPDPALTAKVFLSTQIGKGAFTNGMSYSNPKVDGLYERGVHELDPKKRHAIYRQIVSLLMTDLPMIPLYQQYYVYAYRNRDFVNLPPGISFRDPLEDVRVRARK